ncbi:MAG: beta-galactosidase [Planctomycetes bacterium]|nr:beta-galactosidase [Planctomycetota bacterium]
MTAPTGVLRRIPFLLLLALAQISLGAEWAESSWFAFAPIKDTFGPSVLDGSRWVEAPTGKHGFVTAKGERFVFEDGTPVRFFGAQIGSFSRDQLNYAVRRMRRQGINITRMHGLENLNDRNSRTSFDYSKEGFDRLDYLIAKLGENGIYIILDVHYPLTYRFKPGDGIPGLPQGGPAPHAEFFSDKVAGIMHRRMADVFTHLNPYTNKRYCDDPTVALVEILNEDSLFWGTIAEPFRQELERKFADWLRTKYGDDAGLRKAWTVNGKSPLAEGEGLGPGQRISLLNNGSFNAKFFQARPEQAIRGQDQMRFCLELEDKYWAAGVAALRQAGVKVPISATNWQAHGFATRVHMLGQSRLDYIDRHGYWDHPQGEGNLKWRISTALFHNQPMVKAVQPDQDTLIYLGRGNLVTEKAWEQVLGLPMTISEWNTCLPNRYSLEGTGLMAVYGLLQGWDGLLEFGYFSPDWRDILGSGSFDMLANPPQILQFPAVAAMWHRQDVREAELIAESVYDKESVFGLDDDRKPVPIAAALIGKVGYRFVSQRREPVVKDIRSYWDPDKRIARSTTGELVWNASDGFVTVNTPRTQAVIGFLARAKDLSPLQAVTLRSSTNFGAVYVTAMDGEATIESARRLLVTAVGPARNTGMEYETTAQSSPLGVPYSHLREAGKAPALLEAVTGQMEIRSRLAGQLKAWTLDAVGNRVREVPLTAKSDTVILSLQPESKTVYYEIATE